MGFYTSPGYMSSDSYGGPFWACRYEKLGDPSRTLHLADVARGTGPIWVYSLVGPTDPLPGADDWMCLGIWHGPYGARRCNVLYFDGHVKMETNAWLSRDVSATCAGGIGNAEPWYSFWGPKQDAYGSLFSCLVK